MKKKLSCICILACLLSTLSAANTAVPSKGLQILGVVGKVHAVEVTPIRSSSTTDVNGMPFSITDSTVHATRPEAGRLVANWSLLTNYHPTTVTIEALPMKGVVSNYSLDYILYVKYLYSNTRKDGSTFTTEGNLTVTTNLNGGLASATLVVPANSIDDSFISINNSPVRFSFTQPIDESKTPEDEYLATVKVTVTSD